MIPEDFKQQLLNRIDIVEVIERHVPLRKAGQNFAARCPFHNEKSPSFTVSPSKQFYHCFGCGANGNAIGFLMEYCGLGYVDAVKDLAQMAGLAVPEMKRSESASARSEPSPDLSETLLAAARFYKSELKRSETAIAYLRKRGVTGEIADRFALGYAPPGWQGLAPAFPGYANSAALKEAGLVIDADGGRRYDRFRDRIMFPILSTRGTVIGFGGRVLETGEPKYLNSPETSLFEKGRELYGLFHARQALRAAGSIVVVEGYMDVVALAQHGVGYAVATLGTATTPAHLEKLLRQTDRVVFCFDGDAAGRRAAWRAMEVSLAHLADGKSVGFLFLPDGEDPDTFVRAHGREGFEARLGEAVPLTEFMLRELAGRVELASPEGRARLLHLAKPLVAQIAAPALSLLLRKRLAEIAHVSEQDIAELMGTKRVPSAPAGPAVVRLASRRAPATLTWRVLQAVLQAPELAMQVDAHTLDPLDRAHPALVAILELIRSRPGLGGKDIVPIALDALGDTPEGRLLAEAQADLLAPGAVDAREEFMPAIRALQEQMRARRYTELSTKGKLSEAELAEFKALVADLPRTKTTAEPAGHRV